MRPSLFIVDANVLIDYARTDKAILALVSKRLGSVHVPRSIADEVKQLEAADYEQLALRVVDPTNAQYSEAGNKIPGLSFPDRLCFIMARDEKWTCISNDGPLRKHCTSQKVAVMWSLEPMLLLVEKGHLPPDRAVSVAEAIHVINARYVTRAIVETFAQKAKASTKTKR